MVDGKDLVRHGAVIIGGGDVDDDSGHVGHSVITPMVHGVVSVDHGRVTPTLDVGHLVPVRAVCSTVPYITQ